MSNNTLTKPEQTSEEIAPNRRQLIKRFAELVGGSDNAKCWLNSPHPALGDRTPKSYEDEGKLEAVLTYFIHAIETGQPS
ncbi:MAG: antitoxin Xre/MbcA/ParS toxin-binding domain-containing protein [Cyanobacteriota bacterium]|nr:antitoxin Xre/MbcA/ParS toxin-binding domain-containing protein [Cyanobacteriota bacterium]